MPIYGYTGVDSKGKVIEGAIGAEDPNNARLKLKASGLFITSPLRKEEEKEKTPSIKWWEKGFHKRPPLKTISLMTYQLKVLLVAGLPLPEALDSLITQEENYILKEAITHVKDTISQGSSLADALRKHPDVFNAFYINIIATGEASGNMEEVLEQLSAHLERQEKLRSKVTQALAYPIMMTVIGVGILFFLMTSIVPKVLVVFEDIHASLPLPTKILVWSSSFLASWWHLIFFALLGFVYSIKRFLKSETGRSFWEKFIIKVPLVGRLSLNLVLHRFTKTMGTLLKSGLSLLQALEISKETVHHKEMEASLIKAEEGITSGRPLSDIFKENNFFPPGIAQMVAVGEKTGDLDKAFFMVSEVYEKSIETALGSLLTLIEPALIVIMGGIVGFIVLSILLPIFEMSQIAR